MALRGRLVEAMQRRGVTQAELARELGVSAASVSAWLAGTKHPTTPNLMKIADHLGVTPGYLQFGELRGGDDDAWLAADRTRYEKDLRWYWRPTHRDHGREYGNAAGYAFEPDIDTLARESGQNISDANLETEPTVEARYTVMELTGEELTQFLNRIRFDDVRVHLDAARHTNRKAGSVIERGLEQLNDGRLTLIRIEDFYATGLTGAEFQTGLYMAVVRNLLDSQKRDSAGGSFGLGKATLWASSQFGLVLMNSTLSVAEGGHTEGRFIGRIDLPWHEALNREWAGPGWLGAEDPDDPGDSPKRTVSYWGNQAVAKDLFLDRPAGVSGTSFLIVGAYDASGTVEGVEEIADRFAESLADNFWPAMVDRPDDVPARFRAIVRAERDGQQISEAYINPAKYQPAKVAAFIRHLEDDVTDTLDQPGDVVRRNITLRVPQRRIGEPAHAAVDHEAVLLVAQADESEGDGRSQTAPGTVSFLRGSHMVIQAPKVGALPVGARSFHAILLAGEATSAQSAARAADRFLRAAEPPAHNKWVGTSDITASYVRGGKTALETFVAEVKKAIREIIRQPSRDLSDGPEALKELLRIVPPKAEGKRPRIRSVREHWIDENGAWIIGEATIALPIRPDRLGWIISPVLWFGTESGAPIPVEWATVIPMSQCEVDGRSRLVVRPGARTAKFSATTDPSTHPVGARRAKVLVDVRVHTDEVPA